MSLNHSLSQSNWLPTLDETNEDKTFDSFYYAFKDQIDKDMFTEVNSNIGRKDKDWINEETKNLIKERNRMYHSYIGSPTENK